MGREEHLIIIVKQSIPYDFMPPERHYSSPAELLQDIERFQQSREFAAGDGRFNAPEGKFELLEDGRGECVLMPSARDYAFLFRGQGDFFPECLPTLLRKDRDADHMFLERMRIVEFELMLKQYPAVRYFEEEKLAVDYVGLAQHYGLLTDVLDLTSDVRTALFFAMCYYDSIGDCYHPKSENKEYVAYLYAYPLFKEIMTPGDEMAANFLKRDLKVIGLQPFTRPGSQRGYSFHVRKGNPFKGYLYSFSYTKKDSEDYYDLMINHRHIWEKDFIVEKTHKIMSTPLFTGDALALTNKRYGYGESLGSMQRRMNDLGIHFSADVPWRLSEAERASLNETFEKELKQTVLQEIVNRTMQYGNQQYPVMSLTFMGQQLMLQTLQGGQPCVDGYSSGIIVHLEDDPPKVGLSFDTARPQTIPDASGRVTAFDDILNADAVHSQEALDNRAKLKEQVDKAIKPFRMRRVFVPNDGGEPVYLED